MLAAGSQADSARKHLMLCLAAQIAASLLACAGLPSARLRLSSRSISAPTKQARAGMSATFERPQTTGQKLLNHGPLRTCPCCQRAALPARLVRRNFLAGGIAALGLGASAAAATLTSAAPAAAQAAAKARIDVHH